MGEAYGSRWTTMQGRTINDDGYATDTFVKWCEGTAHLITENWIYGIERMQMKMRADAAHNKDSFPPETPAIWCSWCFPPEIAERDKVKAAGQASQSYKRHPNLIAKDEQAMRLESDPGYAERKKQKGKDTLSDILKGL